MVEPSDSLQSVFEHAIDTAKKLHHEYLTIEHLLYAMLLEDSFNNTIQGFGANAESMKKNLADYLQNKCGEITVADVVVKPKKTQGVERVLNRAFTQVLFHGRQRIEVNDLFGWLAAAWPTTGWLYLWLETNSLAGRRGPRPEDPGIGASADGIRGAPDARAHRFIANR